MAATPVLLLHVDDLGVSHGTVQAMRELGQAGTVTSGSIIVPAPWFPAIVGLFHEMPHLDLGVHLTLTSESTSSRWAPLSTTSRTSGLIDDDGYFWRTVSEVRANAHPEAVAIELNEQVTRARAAGILVTHIDHHMGAALYPEFAKATVALAREQSLPLLFPSEIAAYFELLGKGAVDVAQMERLRDELEEEDGLLFERFAMGLDRAGDTADVYWDLVGALGEGVTFVSLHCCAPGDIHVIHPKDHTRRVEEYELFRDPGFLTRLEGRGVEFVGFEELVGNNRPGGGG